MRTICHRSVIKYTKVKGGRQLCRIQIFTFICLVVCCSVCSLCSLKTLSLASLSLLYDSSEASFDKAESLIVTGDDPLISLVSAAVPVMTATAQGIKRQAGKGDRQAISKTHSNTQTKIQKDWQTINQANRETCDNRGRRSIEKSRQTGN